MNQLTRQVVVILAVAGLSLATLGFAAESASAASPPNVVTGPTSAVTVAAATFAGDVNSNGLSTTWYFEYGTSAEYGLASASGSVGAVAQDEGVAIRVSGLTPGTTYHYRLVARSKEGAAYGHDASFRTPAYPPTILKTSVSVIRDTSAGIVTKIDPYGLATSWYVRYGTTAGFSSATAVHAAGSGIAALVLGARVTGLAPESSYIAEVVATNAAGTRVGSTISFATTGPPAISSTTVGALSPKSATLNGLVNPDGHHTTWFFQYGTTTSYGKTTAIGRIDPSMAPVPVARSITGLIANTSYHFRLVAASAAGTIAGTDSIFTTPGPTLGSSARSVTFGQGTALSGTLPVTSANEPVVIYAQASANPSFVELATVLTGVGGSWTYGVAPQIGTTYKAIWKGEVSPTVAVEVSPSITLRERQTRRFVTHVTGANSFAGRVVRLQRLEHGVWRTVSSRRLNHESAAAFRPTLPSGRSRLRVYLTAFQAGSGYGAGFSGVHLYSLP